MNIVVFGLSISSAWGNGHATLLRGLFRALHEAGHRVTFFEKDVPYYASHRDATEFPFVNLQLYREFADIKTYARRAVANADVAMVTSYCADGALACDLVLGSRASMRVFYDMDTPVTLLRLEQGESVPYVPREGLGGFDLVLSYTGGDALRLLRERLGARSVVPLYGWVDPDLYHPVPPANAYQCELSYLGTYAADRQQALEELLLNPARAYPDRKFVIGGAMYPDVSSWPKNVQHFDHVAPHEHCAFYSSAPLTLNITRGSMAAMGYCPSGRLFEAAACGTAVVSDFWEGLEEFFRPGEEILIARSGEDVENLIRLDPEELRRIGRQARARTLAEHTAELRAKQLIHLVESARSQGIDSRDAMRMRA